jgi:hypothetical protein
MLDFLNEYFVDSSEVRKAYPRTRRAVSQLITNRGKIWQELATPDVSFFIHSKTHLIINSLLCPSQLPLQRNITVSFPSILPSSKLFDFPTEA